MQDWLVLLTGYAVWVINGMVLVIIVIATVQAFVTGLRSMLAPGATSEERQAVWLRFGRWLVAAVTFQLAADVLETAITPGWEELGRLGAIAAIRTIISYSIERDLMAGRHQRGKEEQDAPGQNEA